ncbi:MAG: CmpA/NrtA family ABC transporter substrate-binding protein [Pseudomonadota bacterium]
MSLSAIECGFIPLVDSAPLVVARELGFAAEEGLDLRLHKERSWSALRDKLAFGRLDAAHMLAPAPVAMSMGLGGMPMRIDALSVLSINGDVVCVSPELASKMRDNGLPPDLLAAEGIGRSLIAAAPRPLKIGVPFPFSMHAELLYYWFGALGLAAPQELVVRTVPPPLMGEAMAAGEIDAFCVGEPWGSVAVSKGVAELVMPACAIWAFAPEKVLAVRHDWVGERPDAAEALMRAVWRAGRWLAEPGNAMTAAEFLSRAAYLDIGSYAIERTLAGRVVVSESGEERAAPRLIAFFDGAATFPWRSQAVWIATRLAERNGLDRAEAARAGRSCFRSDLYRAHLGPIGADLPMSSEKLEGSLTERTRVASSTGEMMLGPDRFFDGRVFDPETASGARSD